MLLTSCVRALREAADSILSVVLAPACAACHEPLDHPIQGPVCARCWRNVLPLTPPTCDRCGDPLPSWRSISLPLALAARGESLAAFDGRCILAGCVAPPSNIPDILGLRDLPARRLARLGATPDFHHGLLCPRCRRAGGALDRARAVGAYDGTLRSIIHAIKYDARRSLARPLGTLMRERGADVLENAACAVPVPLHPTRRCMRGFNQAADLARYLGIPVVAALRRVEATRPQTGLPAAQRHRNMRGAFAVTRAGRTLSGATVVLVDDVSTTGATLEACARVLKESGVAEVRALTAARVVGRVAYSASQD